MPTGNPTTVPRRSSRTGWPGPCHDAPVLLAAAAEMLAPPAARALAEHGSLDEPAQCVAALDEAHRALVRALGDPGLTELDRDRIGAVLLRIGQGRAAASAACTDRRPALSSLTTLMGRFRTATSAAGLLERAPREIADLGYDRCLVSRVHEGRWIAQSSYVRGDAELAAAITLAGSEVPATLDRRLLESDLVRKRAPMLVSDAQRNPRVHRRLIDVTASTAYVAAPILVGDAVVGFVHVDRTRRSDAVGEDDVEMLGLVVECLGYALERAIQHDRLQAARASLASWSSSTLGLLGDVTRAFESGPAPEPMAPLLVPVTPHGRPAARGHRRPGLERLTARELEVLDRVAAGEGNAAIALGLFITQATVKAHVKHIFRKLGVANRAEAVSVYLRR